MSKSLDPKYKEVICPLILEHSRRDGLVAWQPVVDDLTDLIVDTALPNDSNETLKTCWTNRIKACAKLLNMEFEDGFASWKAVFTKRDNSRTSCATTSIESPAPPSSVASSPSPAAVSPSEAQSSEASSEASLSEASSSNASSSTSASSSSSSTLPTLRTRISDDDKVRFRKMFAALDHSKFWRLNTTKTKNDGGDTESVEEKIAKFALECNYLHPCHSLILDLNDPNWQVVFTQDELHEMQIFGPPLVRPMPYDLSKILKDIKDMDTLEVYKYAHAIPHDPTTDHIKTWLSLTLTSLSSMFLCNNTGVGRAGENDVMYESWSFLSKVFRGTTITAQGKEKTSKANGFAKNAKRKLSAVDQVEHKRMGRRMDAIYEGSNVELGCLEIGQISDQTKEMHDSKLKLPMVMKDMMLAIMTSAPDLLHHIHIVGYNINGHQIEMLDLDCPSGYISRIRRTKPLPFPSSASDFIPRISSLLQLAVLGKTIMEETQTAYDHHQISLQPSIPLTTFPPCFIPAPKSLNKPHKSASSSISSSHSANSNNTKRQRSL